LGYFIDDLLFTQLECWPNLHRSCIEMWPRRTGFGPAAWR
jgi:hypothetical protein